MTKKLTHDFDKCISCRLKDVRQDGIYCTCGRELGWRCPYYATSTIHEMWAKACGKLRCAVFGDGEFFTVAVDGQVRCVTLMGGRDHDAVIREVINPLFAQWGIPHTEIEADIVVEMLEKCK